MKIGGHLCPLGSKKGFENPKVGKFRWFFFFKLRCLQNRFSGFDDPFIPTADKFDFFSDERREVFKYYKDFTVEKGIKQVTIRQDSISEVT